MNNLARELQEKILSVCEAHGLHLYGVNGFEEKEGTLRFIFTVATEKRSLSPQDKEILLELGLSPYHLDKNLSNSENWDSYIISGLNRDSKELPVVIKNTVTNTEYFCSIDKANSMKISED